MSASLDWLPRLTRCQRSEQPRRLIKIVKPRAQRPQRPSLVPIMSAPTVDISLGMISEGSLKTSVL